MDWNFWRWPEPIQEREIFGDRHGQGVAQFVGQHRQEFTLALIKFGLLLGLPAEVFSLPTGLMGRGVEIFQPGT